MRRKFLRTEGSFSVADEIRLQKLFEKMALTLTVNVSGAPHRTFKAFLQPLRYKNKMYLSGVPTELGFDSLKKYLMLALPEANLDEIDDRTIRLFIDGQHLNIDHCEKVFYKQKPLYYWAIVSKEE